MAGGSSFQVPLDAGIPIPGYVASSSSTRQATTTPTMGSSFLKMFVGKTAEMLFLPRGYIIEPELLSKHWFSISAPSGSVYKVWMESYLDGLVLRNGWSDLMDREDVSQGDIGVFARTDSLAFSLTIMTRGGLEKEPIHRQPEPTDLQRSPVKWEDVRKRVAKMFRRGFNTLVFLIGWMLWKQRNARTFDAQLRSPAELAEDIQEVAEDWRLAGFGQLGVLLSRH